MISIETEFFKSGYVFDKTTQSLSSIPHNYDDCRLKINDYVTSDAFNSSIKKLFYNMLYLYRGCKVADFKLFESYLYNLSTSDNAPYFNGIFNRYTSTTSRYAFLTGAVAGTLLPYDEERKGNVLFFADRKSITCLVLDKSNATFKFNTVNIDPLSGDIQFNNIVDVKFDGRNNLFIVDSSYKNVYKYDITNFLINENIYQDRLFLSDVLGGDGGVRDRNKFSTIDNITLNESLLIVQDSGNKSFKIFDTNFNWLGTSTFTRLFDEIGSFTCMILRDNGVLLCGKGKSIYKFIIDRNTLVFTERFSLASYLSQDEVIINFESMKVLPNIMYLVTNKSVKKLWDTSLDYIVGEFILQDSDINVKWLAASYLDPDFDGVVLYGYGANKDNLSFSRDNVFFESLLNNSNFDIYSLESCYIDKNEYVQSFTILKSLEKIYINTIVLLQNIKYKFFEDESLPYPVIVQKDYNKSFLGFIGDIKFEDDFNIGVNEIFQSEVINRCIRKIVELQQTILLFFINNQSNKRYLSPNPGRNISGIREYTYFADESIILSPTPAKIQIFEDLSPGPGILTSLGGAPYTGIGGINISEGVTN